MLWVNVSRLNAGFAGTLRGRLSTFSKIVLHERRMPYNQETACRMTYSKRTISPVVISKAAAFTRSGVRRFNRPSCIDLSENNNSRIHIKLRYLPGRHLPKPMLLPLAHWAMQEALSVREIGDR